MNEGKAIFEILLFGAGWGGDAWLVDQVDLDRGVLDLHECPQMRPLADPEMSKWPLPVQFCIDRYSVLGGMYLIGYAGVKPSEMEIMRMIVQGYSKPVEPEVFEPVIK